MAFAYFYAIIHYSCLVCILFGITILPYFSIFKTLSIYFLKQRLLWWRVHCGPLGVRAVLLYGGLWTAKCSIWSFSLKINISQGGMSLQCKQWGGDKSETQLISQNLLSLETCAKIVSNPLLNEPGKRQRAVMLSAACIRIYKRTLHLMH